MPIAQSTIDLTQIDFPTDRLTIKELRKAIPNSFDLPARENYNRFDHQGWLKRESLENYLGSVINTEREIAALAFQETLGSPKTEIVGPRWAAVEALSRDYVVLGMTQGEHGAHELIRQIETQAAAQAQRHIDPTPGR